MLFHVLAHVEADQLDAHDVGQLLGGFGLTDPGGTGEQEGANRLVALAQARARHFHGRGQHIERLVLAKDDVLQIALQRLELAAVVVGHIGRRDARNLGDDVFHLGLADGLLALAGRQDALGRTGLVDDVDGLVGQMPVVDVLGAQLGGGLQRSDGVLDVVVLLETRLEALEDFHRLFNGRLDHVDLLEAPRQRRVFFKNAAVFGEGGGANALELPRTQSGLEQVGGVQRAPRGGTGTDQGVDFVDKKDRVGLVL